MKSIKQQVSRFLPYRFVKLTKRTIHFGSAFRCQVCGSSVRHLVDNGQKYPVLDELDVVGGGWRPHDRCPVCHANDRIRLLLYYLKTETGIFQKGGKVLHFAPERALDEKLLAALGVDHYVPADLDARRYRHLRNFRKCDITSLPFGDGEFDWIICCHVLEHVPDDRRALRELRRVLRPDGVAILQVPVARKLEHTREDYSATTRETRILRFGQADHVRLYAPDFAERLMEAGFDVTIYSGANAGDSAVGEWRLNPREQLFLCRPDAAKVATVPPGGFPTCVAESERTAGL